MKKEQFDDVFKKYGPVMKKTGKQLTKAVKAAEEDISKMYRIAQNHVEIQMKNLQKEKLYHEIGRYVAKKITAGDTDYADMEKYRAKLEKIEKDSNKLKGKLIRISNIRAKKVSKKDKKENAE